MRPSSRRSLAFHYPEAVEAALDYLDERDPLRSGEVSGIEILRVEGEEREVVCRYGHSRTRPADDLVRVRASTSPSQGRGRRVAA